MLHLRSVVRHTQRHLRLSSSVRQCLWFSSVNQSYSDPSKHGFTFDIDNPDKPADKYKKGGIYAVNEDDEDEDDFHEEKVKDVDGFRAEETRAKENSLTLTVTPEMEKEITGDNLGKKFILKQALSEIISNENRTYYMVYPKSLTTDQWQQLISFTDFRSRFYYLDSLLSSEMSLEEIIEYDDKFNRPLEIPEEMINQVCGDDEAARKKINLFLFHVSFNF